MADNKQQPQDRSQPQQQRGQQQQGQRGEEPRGGSMQRASSSEQGLGRGSSYSYGGGSRGSLTPFGFMRRMMEDMDRLFGFDTVFGGGVGPSILPQQQFQQLQQMWSPQVEVFEKSGNLVVRADLPGLGKDDVQIRLDDNGALVISGERKSEKEEEREGIYHSERSYGSFERRIPLPRGVDASACNATFDNGVLEVTLKLPATTSRNVPIQGAAQREQLGAAGKKEREQRAQPPVTQGTMPTQNDGEGSTPSRH